MNGNTHKTVELGLKCGTVDVDEEIVPLIKWMDSLETVETYACCQGDEVVDPTDTDTMPYVFFTAQHDDLVEIANKLMVFAYNSSASIKVGVKARIPQGPTSLEYVLRFKDRTRFKWILSQIRENGEPRDWWASFVTHYDERQKEKK